MKHTKEKWEVENTTVYALEVERENVITGKPIMRNRFSALVQGYIPKEELKANARLMAAAPIMLKALQEIAESADAGEARTIAKITLDDVLIQGT